MASSKLLIWILPAILAVSILPSIVASVFAQESPGEHIINRVEIWGLFYRLMVIAFTVGAVVMGVIAYVIFRFRESNPKNIPKAHTEGQH
jgi:heme/copper-type cytochrome/quinol oxidase subunit 2